MTSEFLGNWAEAPPSPVLPPSQDPQSNKSTGPVISTADFGSVFLLIWHHPLILPIDLSQAVGLSPVSAFA